MATNLTPLPPRLQALQTFVAANPTTSPLFLQPEITPENIATIVTFLNTETTDKVWKWAVPVDEIMDTVIYANFTPPNPSASVTALAAANIQNWIQQCGLKQMNLQNILVGANASGAINTRRKNIRDGLKDCLSQIPSGGAAAGVPAIGGGVR